MRAFHVIACGLAALFVCGCAGYRLGPVGEVAAGEKALQVQPFLNQTLEPRLGDAVTSAVRRQLQRDGTYRLATRDDGDVVVSGVLTHYQRRELSFLPNDVLTVSDFRVSVTAHVTAREKSTGRTILDQDVSGYTLVRVGADLTSAERQALPVLADELAKNIRALLTEGSW
jgi:hypothetical protein